MKHVVWNNDVCNMYDSIKECPEEFFPEMENEDITDDMMWNEAYDSIERWLDDEMTNCDVDVDNHIFLIGTLERWNGAFPVHKDLGTTNIGEAFQKAMRCFGGDNTFEIYVEKGKLLISQTGHDNPTNPSIMEFRYMRDADSIDDFLFDHIGTSKNIRRNSRGLAKEVGKVYGWCK